MTTPFTAARAAELGDAERRSTAAQTAAATGLPDTSAEGWRYSPVAELDLDALSPVTVAPTTGLPASSDHGDHLNDAHAAATVTVVDGFVAAIEIADGWADKGLRIRTATPELTDLPDDATIFDHLFRAFAPAGLVIEVGEGAAIDGPVLIRSHLTETAAAFPSVTVKASEGSSVTVFELQSSAGQGLTVPVVFFDVAPGATVEYALLQDLDHATWQLGRILASVGEHGTLRNGLISFGGRYARLRTDTDLAGRGARSELVGAYFGDGEQVLDYRTFQQHRAPDTVSDLLFKGTVDDRAGSVYTGMIHIHPDGAGSNAFQTNRNIKLGDDAWAWSVPNLEIENNDVRCSHASTVSPVDPDQRFYLHSRGVPPAVADRLIVAGFYEQALRRIPVRSAAAIARSLIAGKLDQRLTIE